VRPYECRVNPHISGEHGRSTDRSAGAYRPSRLRPQHLCLTGRVTFPRITTRFYRCVSRLSIPSARLITGDAFGTARQSPQAFALSTLAGITEREGRPPLVSAGITEGREDGAAAVECASSNRPCPLRDQKPLRAHGPPPTVAGPPGGRKLPIQALECQDWHGCGRDVRPQSYLIVKVRPAAIQDVAELDPNQLQRSWRLHRAGSLSADFKEAVTGLQHPAPTIHVSS